MLKITNEDQVEEITNKNFRKIDNWSWEISIIDKMKAYAKNNSLTALQLFKAFDTDFDGIINKQDLKKSLIQLLNIEPENILSSKLDRL